MNETVASARKALLDYGAEANRRASRAKAKGELIGWVSTKFPAEIPAALGLITLCPESLAAAIASKGESLPLLEEAGRLGYTDDLCSYSRIGLAIAAGQAGAIPLPDYLLCCNNICTNMIGWYKNLARILQVPLFLLDIPYTGRWAPPPEILPYLKGQFQQLTAGLARFTGREWKQENFISACRNAQATAKSWAKLSSLLEAPGCPWDGMELFDYMGVLVNRRCEAGTAPLLDNLAEVLANLPPAKAKPTARLMLEGTPCWANLQELLTPLRSANIQIVADTITPSLGFIYDDIDSFLLAYCGTINGASLEKGFENRRALCKARKVDGILIHYNRSCRPWCGTLPQLTRMLEQEGWPVISFEGDQADPKAFNPGQYSLRMQALREIFEKPET